MEVDKPKRAAGAVAQQVGQKQRFAKLDGLTVWVRQDEGLRYAPSTVEAGPLWATVYKRVVKDMSTGEVVLDQDTKGKTVQECCLTPSKPLRPHSIMMFWQSPAWTQISKL